MYEMDNSGSFDLSQPEYNASLGSSSPLSVAARDRMVTAHSYTCVKSTWPSSQVMVAAYNEPNATLYSKEPSTGWQARRGYNGDFGYTGDVAFDEETVLLGSGANNEAYFYSIYVPGTPSPTISSAPSPVPTVSPTLSPTALFTTSVAPVHKNDKHSQISAS